MIFKIYGERNSGTNFLTNLLKNNFGQNHVFEDYLDLNTSICYYWKHGYPDTKFNNINERVINIFIIRDLTKWLVSMYHNPYCLDYNNNSRSFEHFITQKHEIELKNGQVIQNISATKCILKWIQTLFFLNSSNKFISNNNIISFLNKQIRYHRLRNIIPTCYIREHINLRPINYSDHNLNIFDIRYNKFNEYLNFSKSNESLFVSLDDIQFDNNCIQFLQMLSDKYNIPLYKVKLLNLNLKTHSKNKNTKYTTNPNNYISIINKYRNTELENLIKNHCF